jgi:glycosyltransferase involved in cell wall biosynthesis
VRAAGLQDGLDYVVFTGRFAEWVDFDTILEGFALAARERPRARLVLVGDGPEAALVSALIDRLGLGDRVLRPGFVSDPDAVLALVGAATVALSANRPSLRARIGVSPVKLAEYLAAGRAVVATDIPGVRETVSASGAGIVTPVDAAAFGAAIGELLDDPARADGLGAAGREAAVDRYSWPSVVRRTMPLFGI